MPQDHALRRPLLIASAILAVMLAFGGCSLPPLPGATTPPVDTPAATEVAEVAQVAEVAPTAVEASATAASTVEANTVESTTIESTTVESTIVESTAVESTAVETSSADTEPITTTAHEMATFEAPAVEVATVEAPSTETPTAVPPTEEPPTQEPPTVEAPIAETPAAEMTAETPADPMSAFEQQLEDAIVAADFDTLQSMMSEAFRLSLFESEGRIIALDEAVGELRDIYLASAAAPVIDKSVDIAALLGADPLSIWGEDVVVSDTLFVRGMGEDGATEALLAIGEDGSGDYAWVGILAAPVGFGGTPVAAEAETLPAAAVESAVAAIRIVRMTNVYPAPDPDVAPLGLARRDDELTVLGEDEAGDYYLVECPVGMEPQCWVVNDPGAVEAMESAPVVEVATEEPTSTPEVEAQPVEEPAPAFAAVDTSDAERIEFEGDAVATTLTGSAVVGEPIAYVIKANAGQAMTVDLVSENDLANFSITGATNGQPYKRVVNEDRIFVFTVPVTQDYVIGIETTEGTDFALTVILPPQGPQPAAATPENTTTEAEPIAEPIAEPTPEPESAPESAPVTEAVSTENATRLSVDPGETSVSVTEIIDQYGDDEYVVRAVEGQTMVVAVDSIEDIVNFSIVGVSDGQPLKRLENEDRTWSGVLPATQDYLITVDNTHGVRVEYTLDVSFSPLEKGDPQAETSADSSAERIQFDAGESSDFVSGSVPEGGAANYVIEALGGQTMSVSLYPTGPATFSVAGADGEVLKSAGAGGPEWSGALPADQDYLISVAATDGAIDFDMIVQVTD